MEVVHDDLCSVELVPLVGAEGADERHAERVGLGEDVHVAQVSGEEEKGMRNLHSQNFNYFLYNNNIVAKM